MRRLWIRTKQLLNGVQSCSAWSTRRSKHGRPERVRPISSLLRAQLQSPFSSPWPQIGCPLGSSRGSCGCSLEHFQLAQSRRLIPLFWLFFFPVSSSFNHIAEILKSKLTGTVVIHFILRSAENSNLSIFHTDFIKEKKLYYPR